MSFDEKYIRGRLQALTESRLFDYDAAAESTEIAILGRTDINTTFVPSYGIFARAECGAALAILTGAYLRYCDSEKTDPQRHLSTLSSEIDRFYRMARDRFQAFAANRLKINIKPSIVRAFDEYMIQFRKEADSALVDAAKGRLHDEQIYRQVQTASAQGFVAMSFRPGMLSAYEDGIEVGITAAGYTPLRVDRHEHLNKIDDEIIGQIRRSRCVVADFTGQRPSVYYEAGFAYGLNLPVIMCCRKDEFKKLHFDVRQFNCIIWSNAAQLARLLEQRIGRAIGPGPNFLAQSATKPPSRRRGSGKRP
jgi:nucleoside 2-deoxyribosyltransferase